MEKKEYGYIENGILYSRWIEERQERFTNEDGETQIRTVTIEEQVSALSDEWKPVDLIDSVKLTSDDPDYIVTLQPYDAGDRISYNYIKKFDVKRVEDKIQELKMELTETDYKVIKCYEASLTGQEPPYDINAVRELRQGKRDKINELESLLRNYPQNVIVL